MFSRVFKRLRRNTALELTLKFAVLFFISALAIFITVDLLLVQVQREKDLQLIESFLESYQRLERSAGLHKLELVIERDTPYFQRTDMWLELTDANAQPLLHVQPEQWPAAASPELDRLTSGDWLEAPLPGSDLTLMFGQASLSDGLQLRIGRSTKHRVDALADYRRIILRVMLPLFILGLMLTYYMNWRALRQVKDLIDTVHSLSATDLEARVQIRNPRSELGELAQLFNAMLSQIQRLILGMQHSLDAVAHDLRTPLSRMRLSIESALDGTSDTALHEALLDCAEESEKIETMLRILMDISEVESGTLRLHRERLDLNTLINDCMELYHYSAEHKQITLQAASGEAVELVADKIRIQQVVGNLIDNAIKYSKHGGRINLSCHDMGSAVKVEIIDQGMGIDPKDQERVFDRLYRADPSRGEPGIGLGLSLVKAIVEAHGGSIELESALGKGCKVSVILPKGDKHIHP